ncbi:hypothetical protein HAX54_021748, partial [Datura stramonium]|nr:hypothetical protein [Datura stramonium]
CQGVFQGLRHFHNENQGRKYKIAAKLRNWGSEEFSHSRIEGMIEMVMERVLSTDLGI